MNKSFILFDKNNNTQKIATMIVKFNFDGKDYLIYSVDENEQNSQIFVSKLVLNSEGKIFIDNIMNDEKSKVNNIVYNIVILMPSEAQKGLSFDELVSNFLTKFSTSVSNDLPQLDVQEYYSSCSVAITNKLLVDASIKFYGENLNKKVEVVEVPVWTAPSTVTAPTPTPVTANVNQEVIAPVSEVAINTVPSVAPVLNSQPVTPVVEPSVINTVPTSVSNTAQVNTEVKTNPQLEKLAVVSDPSLGIGVSQPNLGKNKEAGYANTKYIVIGTVCLVLSITVVVAAFILINNMA